MMEAGARRSGRTAGWRGTRGLPDGRASLLAALEAYRRGVAEAPVVCKRVLRQAQDEREVGMAVATGLPRCARNDNTWVVRRAQDEPFWDGGGSEKAGAGPLVFVASTGEVDRHGDTVAPEGWRLDAYRDNPVVLWAHDYGEPPIGRAEAVWSDGRALRARLAFAPTEFAGQVERLYRQGYQRGVSVGFRPLRFEERRDSVNGAFLGIRFLEQELLEISAVPVPANGKALLAEEAALTPAIFQRERGQVADEVVGLLRGLRN
jgi:HK97 family phage prohead protease